VYWNLDINTIEERRIEGFGGETGGKEITWETQA